MKNLKPLFYLFLFSLLLLWEHPTQAAPSAAISFNGGFETDANKDGKPDEWSWPTSYWVWDKVVYHAGTRSARVSRSGGAATTSLWSKNLPVKPSTTYTLSFWLRTQNASRRPNVVLFQHNGANAQLGSRYMVYVNVTGTTGWQKVTYRFQSAAQATYVKLRIDLSNAQTGTFWFDDFDLAEGQTALFPVRTGFPLETTDWIDGVAPTVADIDNNGQKELLVADYRGRVYAWNPSGQLKSGFPLTTNGHIIGHLALGDLNRDGDLEIVAGVGSTGIGQQGRVFAWNPQGTLLSGWPQNVARWLGYAVVSKVPTVVLADLDSDQDLEVIAGTNNNNLTTNFIPYVPNLYVWHHTGSLASGWPIEDPFDSAILGTVAAGDLNGDGQGDIMTGRDYQSIFAYNKAGKSLPGWPVLTKEPPSDMVVHRFAAPTMADIDRNGVVDYIVAGQRRHSSTPIAHTTSLMVLQPNGSRHSKWATPANGKNILSNAMWMQQAPVVADLNNDSLLDIIVPTQDGWIRAYKPDKTLLWEFNYANGAYIYASEPVVGDIDNDGLNEVVFGTFDPNHGGLGPVGLWILEHNGAVKPGSPLAVGSSGIHGAPSLVDFDNDNLLEIVAATNVGQIYVWETQTPFNPARFPWPVARHNLQRTAFVKTSAPSLNASVKVVNPVAAEKGDEVTFVVRLVRTGPSLKETVKVVETIPQGLSYIPGTLTANSGTVTQGSGATLHWSGSLANIDQVEIRYRARVTTGSLASLLSKTDIQAGSLGQITRTTFVVVNGLKLYFPMVKK